MGEELLAALLGHITGRLEVRCDRLVWEQDASDGGWSARVQTRRVPVKPLWSSGAIAARKKAAWCARQSCLVSACPPRARVAQHRPAPRRSHPASR